LVWALDGHGILMRSEWDVQSHLRSGALKLVLPDWSLPSADVYAVYCERMNLSAKVSALIDFLAQWFARATNDMEDAGGPAGIPAGIWG
jgi:DNA-binding transcriptional LysR family regulator